MADKGSIDLALNTLDPAIRKPIANAIKDLADNWRLGEPDEGRRATNAQWYLRSATTPASSNTEFTIAHGLGAAPIAIYPALFLDQVNSQIVPLKVTRAADASRVYLSSPSTSAVFFCWIEA